MAAGDDMQDAENDVVEQERWGVGRSDMTLARIVRLLRPVRAKLVDLEARLRALEGK